MVARATIVHRDDMHAATSQAKQEGRQRRQCLALAGFHFDDLRAK
jgi:hypothetical protein